MLCSSRNVALWSVLLACCGTSTPSGDDAATGADTGAETSGTAGGSGGVGGASGTSGGGAGVGGASGSGAGVGGASGGNGGNGAAGAGSGGTTAGRGGSADGGGAAGSSGGQAGTSVGDRDAARDTADASSDATPDRSLDASNEAGTDASDARADTSMPPSDGAGCTPLPSAGVYATFRVVNDVFYASITNPPGIDQALALWRGQSQAKIPVGQLQCTSGAFNCGWSWSMSPSSITFAELTIEVCDATPSYVQGNCTSFPNGTYCPWSAELTDLRDCRTQASCPPVPR